MKKRSFKNIFTGRLFKVSLPFGIIALLTLASCNYLDIVPDNIPTIDNAFRNREEARRYMYGCFSFMPEVGRMTEDPAMHGSDEVFTTERAGNNDLRRILLGEQGTVSPLANYWASKRNDQTRVPKALWTGISDCNIFLENINKPFDLMDWERDQWRGEVLFAKAYMHFWLFRQYGPIPLMRKNLDITSDAQELQIYREPVDSVVNYIVELLDEAINLLPPTVADEMMELGRPTKCIASALKAEVLTLAASPLFNCNSDLADYKDNRGIQLFPQDKSVEIQKWEKAAQALKEAIDMAHENRYRLYDAHIDFPNAPLLHEPTIMAMQMRGAATERWNPEIIWGNSRANNNGSLQQMCLPVFASDQKNGAGNKSYGVPLHIVKQFYTKNGLPIEDDQDWVGRNIWAMRTPKNTGEELYYFQQGGYQSISLHFDREARFYSSINFDGGKYLGNNRITADNTETDLWTQEMRFSAAGMQGWSVDERSNLTGYICKKLVHYRTTASGQSYSAYTYAFPIIRLADLYLLYAEALNESKASPDASVYEYIDKVRARTGLKGVVESWSTYAIPSRKNLPLTKEGMREIIQRERLNELAFEGARFWDLRRWKLAESYINNKPIIGLDVFGWNLNEFYREVVLFTPKFEKKDYFFPIRMNARLYNINLLQSPGW